ncbi:MAG: glycosyltransferase family 2 protein [Anaerolineaceae bacterium]|nr:glycosyltransferase family 2 protein [Anaerolineaceae bacterium]
MDRIKENNYKKHFNKPFLYLRRFTKGLLMCAKELANLKKVNLDQAYKTWIFQNELNSAALKEQKTQTEKLSYQPLITIVVPIHNPNLEELEQMMDSLIAQTYSHWELCLAGCMPEPVGFGQRIWQLIGTDERIHIRHLDENLGISGNTKAAAEMAKGEFLAFVDQDDMLSPDALFEVVKALNADKDIDLLYSDHDILSNDGQRRFNPLFKPDWSPEILLSANYVTHLSVVRKSVFHKLGGLDSALDGAQDLDLMLRLSEGNYKVRHIPKILYHWRESSGSTAVNFANKPYTMESQLKAISAHLSRLGLSDVGVDQRETGYIHVKWKVDPLPKVSIIILSRGVNRKLKACLRSILELTVYPDYEILIINNGGKSAEELPYFREVQQNKRIRVLNFDPPFNYSAVNNFGARHAEGDLLLFLNDDTEVIHADWLEELVMWASRPEIGAVGAQLLYYDKTIQHAGVVLGLTGFAGHIFNRMRFNDFTIFGLPMWYRNYLAVTGACLMMRREVLEEVGWWPEDLALCGNDVVLGMRLNAAGYRVVYDPFVRLYHHESATHKGNIPSEDFRTSYLYYREILQAGDPYFNPNLSLWSAQPCLRKIGESSSIQFVREFFERLAL